MIRPTDAQQCIHRSVNELHLHNAEYWLVWHAIHHTVNQSMFKVGMGRQFVIIVCDILYRRGGCLDPAHGSEIT